MKPGFSLIYTKCITGKDISSINGKYSCRYNEIQGAAISYLLRINIPMYYNKDNILYPEQIPIHFNKVI